jgi:hypothetical protein
MTAASEKLRVRVAHHLPVAPRVGDIFATIEVTRSGVRREVPCLFVPVHDAPNSHERQPHHVA